MQEILAYTCNSSLGTNAKIKQALLPSPVDPLLVNGRGAGGEGVTTLAEEAALLGITLTPEHEAAFAVYARELAEWNAHTNLTAITDEEGVRVKHFLDSLTVARAAQLDEASTARMVDVGTGAGFPGLPLKIVFPHIHLTLMEATGKKLAFCQHIADSLDLRDVTTLHARAEEAGQMPDQRAAYDVVVARAVARLPVLLEYLLPLARVGGRCIAMKGSTAHDEARASARALQVLGGRLAEIQTFALPGVDEPHHLVVVEKVAPTPASYPRKPGQPAQKPL